MQYTTDQQKVIDTRNKNILVSAAAGSGKTAVLVERIISMVTDTEHPVDIDRLLIVTFTSAAAAEMRERISQAINRKLEEEPENEHLQKQVTLIHNAQITTIHSFCLNVIRNNFNDIGLDPSFRTADEGEVRLLEQDVLDAVLEEKFEGGDEDFLHCVECYSMGGRESVLEEQILKLYHFAESYPNPEKWLQYCKEDYKIASEEELEQKNWVKYMQSYIGMVLTDCLRMLEDIKAICEENDGPYMYLPAIEADMAMIINLMQEEKYQNRYQCLAAFTWTTLSRKSDDMVSLEKKENAKQIRDGVKNCIKKIKERYYFAPIESILERTKYCSRALDTLIDLTVQFKQELWEKKKEKNIIDFGDMEHLALDILTEEKDGKLEQTKAAKDYSDYFYEIMCDEYQDSNMIQEEILKSVSKEEKGEWNRFMVGDVKQSIYKFRLARPEIFMEKYNTYDADGEKCQRIDLSMNFRSRQEVLDSINFIFGQIMCEPLGQIEYDEKAALYVGADYYPEGTENETELILIEKPGKEDEETGKEREALAIAMRIHELMRSKQVYDKDLMTMRPISYRDIVILLRSNRGWDDEFKKVLDEQGIPCYTASKSGYFDTWEIRTVIQILKTLDNPLQDIPLFGTLESIFGGFSDEELAQIKAVYKQQHKGLYENELYFALKYCAEELEGSELTKLSDRAAAFLTFLETYRNKAKYMPIRQLLQELFNEVGYEQYVNAMPGGEQRRANIELLLQKASAFEQTSYFGTFHFIRYLEQIMEKEVDYGEADVLDENADVVRIMSIHKSKGLEFPVCFVAGLGKKFNMTDTTKTLIMDADMGIGTDYINEEKRLQSKTLRKSVIARKIAQDNLAEEIRILYVALTRAKEKLIMTGVIGLAEKTLQSIQKYLPWKEDILPFLDLSEQTTPLGYILMALARSRSMMDVIDRYKLDIMDDVELAEKSPYFSIRLVDGESLFKEQVEEEVVDVTNREEFEKNAAHYSDEELVKAVKEKFSYQYAHKNLEKLFNKTTVSELKMAHMEEEVETVSLFHEATAKNIVPKFIATEEKTSGTTRGSAFHKVMELLPLTNLLPLTGLAAQKDLMSEQTKLTIGRITDEMDKMVHSGALPQEYAALTSPAKVLQFLQSPLAQRMAQAQRENKLYREQPFVFGISADTLKDEFPREETVLIQGIIDVYFEEADYLVVADYKTDVVSDKEELIKRYEVQLDYYARALEKMTGKIVKEKIIYSSCLGIDFAV